MAREPSLSLHYFGSVTPSGLEAKELLQVLSGFTRIAAKASRTCYGSDTKPSVRIEHVQSGSIDLQWVFELTAVAQTTFAAFPALALGIKDAHDLVKAWLDLLKFLKGQPPQKVQNVTNGNALQIENTNGDITVVNGNIYNTLILNDIGNDAQKLELPTRRGASKLELRRGGKRIATYATSDLASFKPIRPKGSPLQSEIEAILEVVSPVLEGEAMWRFKYGRMSITAKLVDEEYRQKVLDADESFRHGDRLRVRLKTIQETVGKKIVTKHFIVKVEQRVR
jgi:hypothetical protein